MTKTVSEHELKSLTSTEIVHIFNKQVKKLIKELCTVYSDIFQNPSIIFIEKKLKTMMIIQPTNIIEMFYRNIVLKYNEQLKNKNEYFFIKLTNNKHPLYLLSCVYEKAKHTDKEAIWNYLEFFRILSIKYATNL